MTIKVTAVIEFNNDVPADILPWLLSHLISTKLNENFEQINWLVPYTRYVHSVDVKKEEL